MSDAQSEFLLLIKATLEGSGLDAANAKLNELIEKSKEVDVNADLKKLSGVADVGKATAAAGAGFQDMSRHAMAARMLLGSLNNIANGGTVSFGELTGVLRGLGGVMALPALGAAGLALGGIVAAGKALIEAFTAPKKPAEDLDAAATKLTANLKLQADQFADTQAKAAAAAAAVDTMTASENTLAKAIADLDIARLKHQEQEELARTSDPAEQERIKMRYKAAIDSRQSSEADRAAQAAEADALRKINDLNAEQDRIEKNKIERRRNAEAQLPELTRQAGIRSGQRVGDDNWLASQKPFYIAGAEPTERGESLRTPAAAARERRRVEDQLRIEEQKDAERTAAIEEQRTVAEKQLAIAGKGTQAARENAAGSNIATRKAAADLKKKQDDADIAAFWADQDAMVKAQLEQDIRNETEAAPAEISQAAAAVGSARGNVARSQAAVAAARAAGKGRLGDNASQVRQRQAAEAEAEKELSASIARLNAINKKHVSRVDELCDLAEQLGGGLDGMIGALKKTVGKLDKVSSVQSNDRSDG